MAVIIPEEYHYSPVLSEADVMLFKLLLWCRYNRKYTSWEVEYPLYFPYANYTGCVADIYAYHQGEAAEIEIKTSYSDFKKDFVRKEKKHSLYADRRGINKFFFAIPVSAKWRDKASKYLQENFPRYGLLEVRTDNWDRVSYFSDDVSSLKNAYIINKDTLPMPTRKSAQLYGWRKLLQAHYAMEKLQKHLPTVEENL